MADNIFDENGFLTLDESQVVSFAGDQDQGQSSISQDGSSITLTGNAWKAALADISITEDTVITFDLNASDAGEIIGIIFENDDSISNTFGFQLGGSQNWAAFGSNTDFAEYEAGSGTQTVTIPVGQFYTGNFNRLVFVGDDDINASTNATFSNIRVFEAPQLLTNGDFSNGISGWTILNPTGGSAPTVENDGVLSLNYYDESSYGDGVQQAVTTEVGATYNLSLDFFENNAGSSTHTGLVEVLDENNNVITSETVVLPNGSSEKVTIDFVATSTTSTVRITNPTSTNSITTDLKVDDVLLIKTADPTVVVPNLTLSAPADVTEGAADETGSLVFTVTLDTPTTEDVTADVTITGGATGPSTVTILAGQTSAQILLSFDGDDIDEADETITVALTNLSGATGSTLTASAIIIDDDEPVILEFTGNVEDYAVYVDDNGAYTVVRLATGESFSLDGVDAVALTDLGQTFDIETVKSVAIPLPDEDPVLSLSAPSDVTEGDAGETGSLIFTVTLDEASDEDVTADVAISGNASGPTSVTILAGETSAQIALAFDGDDIDEDDETITVTLSNLNGATGTALSASAQILDDDNSLVILEFSGNVEDYAVYVDGEGAYTVVRLATGESFSLDGVDAVTLTDLGQTFDIETVKSIAIPLPDEDPVLSLSAPSDVTEGDAGETGSLVFTVTLDEASDEDVTADVAISGNVSGPTTVTILAGQTSTDIALSFDGDDIEEADETVTVTLSNLNGATGNDLSASANILDDDSSVVDPAAEREQILSSVNGVDADGEYTPDAVGSVRITILDGRNFVMASNYGQSSFAIENTGDKQVAAVLFDYRDALYGDSVIDPDGSAGDSLSKQFAVSTDIGDATGGYFDIDNAEAYFFAGETPLPITDPTAQNKEPTGGFRGNLIKFDGSSDGFTNGETVYFSGDMDPNSIAGLSKSDVDANAVNEWDVGGVSGAELIGSSFTVLYDDGTFSTGYIGAQENDDDTGVNQGAGVGVSTQAAAPDETATVTVNGFDSDATDAVYGGVEPTITVTGTPGSTVRVLLSSGLNPVTNTDKGVADLVAARLADSQSDFQVSNAADFQSVIVTIGQDGTATVPSGSFNYDTTKGIGEFFVGTDYTNGFDTAPIAVAVSVIDPTTGDALGPVDRVYLTNPTNEPIGADQQAILELPGKAPDYVIYVDDADNFTIVNLESGQSYSLDGIDQVTLPEINQTFAVNQAKADAIPLPDQTITSVDAVVLDLDADGSPGPVIDFDFDGDGILENGGWPEGGDGLLALDRNNDGVINDGTEISFSQDLQGATTGLEGLAAYDSNNDGLLTSDDDSFESFIIWTDANSDGVSQAEELQSLTEAEIVAIDLQNDGQVIEFEFAVISGFSDATLADDSTVGVSDVNLVFTEDADIA